MLMLLGELCAVGRADAEAKTAAACDTTLRAGTQSVNLDVDGTARNYLIHVPKEHARERLPLIIALHGRGETAEQLAAYSVLSTLAAVVVYPRGLPGRGGKLSWSGTPTAAPGVDDVRFVDAIVDRVARTSCINPQRIYATGKSDGGGLAAQLACKSADRFAAIAAIAGAYYPVAGGCTPSRAISILEMHGTADRVVPYDGSPKRGLPNIADWLAAWSKRDGCMRENRPRAIASDVTRRRWTGCRDGTIVEGYRIAGGGHTWPGAVARSGPGKTAVDISARDVLASFFAHHALATK